MCTIQSRGKGALGGTREHRSSRLCNVIKAHAQTDFVGKIPLANNGVVRRPGGALEEPYEKTEPIDLMGRLCDGQTTCKYAPQ